MEQVDEFELALLQVEESDDPEEEEEDDMVILLRLDGTVDGKREEIARWGREQEVEMSAERSEVEGQAAGGSRGKQGWFSFSRY